MQLGNLKFVGPKTVEKLNKLNIYTFDDLITYYPYRYDVIKPTDEINLIDNNGTIVGAVESNPTLKFVRKNLNIIRFKFNTQRRLINVVIYNRAFIKDKIVIGNPLTLIGRYNLSTNLFTASDIRFYKLDRTIIEPKYHLNKDISNTMLVKIINNALENELNILDYIPLYLKKAYDFLDKDKAIIQMHHVTNIDLLKKAKLRLIYEELFLFTFKINYLKIKKYKDDVYLPRNVHTDEVIKFIDKLPFELTVDQQTAVDEIISDFSSKKRMNRLLLGDVSSGKTIVAIIALYLNYLDKYQGVLMAPTEILARQHYEKLNAMFSQYNIKCELLVGSLKLREKEEIKNKIKSNEIHVVIGTHALLTDDVEFYNLGLVITDEQHRFGVNQRSCLQNKGNRVDVLYLSATPIPRTYALSLYGDMDTSLIKTKPKGRKEVKTIIKKESEIKEVLHIMLDELKKGHQIFVVAPSIDDNDLELESVHALKEKFSIAFNNMVSIAQLHGKLKSDEKEKVMLDFQNKKYNILISTTVIEVGIDIPDATIIVIFNAERYGLATLHQLRGRVGRNQLDSYCFLISNQECKRLQFLQESNDGFYISQKDLELRKEGDLFGTSQSGDMSFKLANLQRDYKIFMQARNDSEIFLKNNITNNFLNYTMYAQVLSDIDFAD